MSDGERAPYDQRAAADKQRYEQQMSMYVPAPGFSSKGSRKRVSSLVPHLNKWEGIVHIIDSESEICYTIAEDTTALYIRVCVIGCFFINNCSVEKSRCPKKTQICLLTFSGGIP